MKDFIGTPLHIGQNVVFIRDVWDVQHVLHKGVVIGFEYNKIQVEFVETAYKWNTYTEKHDIPEYSTVMRSFSSNQVFGQ
ncbi:hypothetical protein HOV48_gp090 [Rheinheimera phage Barba21A]|uniref:Uncharacterized protein n=1 Tax=Rheinheimera phage Barba21A TaxID=2849598 RepID=A0A4P8N6B3_9CAUD|nr:hypothetical protein HOV48_gp090 [Rheinheimera phage Barba21A]QCQ62350.1 hypothetical protein Barba21A_gp090 [Rheinheimera phage Barba21A]